MSNPSMRLFKPRVAMVLGWCTLASVVVLALFGLWGAPPDKVQSDAQRLMYLHVPTAWVAYLAFGVTAIASALWLWPRTRSTVWDRVAGSSAELGVIFTGLCLVLATAYTIAAGRESVGNSYEAKIQLTRLEGQAHARNSLLLGAGDRSGPELAEQLGKFDMDSSDALRKLAAADGGMEVFQRVDVAVREYRASVEQLQQLHAAGRSEEAAAWSSDRVDQKYAALTSATKYARS